MEWPGRETAQVTAPGSGATGRIAELRRRCSRPAWMLVLPTDAVLLALPALWSPLEWKAILAMTLLAIGLLSASGRYQPRLYLAVLDELPGVWRNLLTSIAVVAIVVALRHDATALPGFLTQAAIGTGMLTLGRVATTSVINLVRRHRVVAYRTLVVGGGSVAADLVESLTHEQRYGLELVGHLGAHNEAIRPDQAPRLGELHDLADVVAAHDVKVLLVADIDESEPLIMEAIEQEACADCDVFIVPRVHYLRTSSEVSDHIGSVPVTRVGRASFGGPRAVAKRGFDLAVAAFFLVLLTPVLALFAALTRLSGPGVIYRQARVGRDGVIFDCLKFRSMRPAPVAQTDVAWSVDDDDRRTAVGTLMRRLSIDELPQLWNVLRGDMSLVGPRPERPFFVDQFAAEIDVYSRRHRVRVGLTGLAQVNGLRGGESSIAERARFDNFYIENWSMWLDAKIMLRTVSEVVFARGR